MLWELFWTFLKIGAFTFGGGYAMLPLVQEQILAHGWLTREELINFLAVSESTPGPFAVNVSTYVGMETAGLAGAFVATLGVALPSFAVILLVARCFRRFRSSRLVRGTMAGLKPAVIGLIGGAVLSTGRTVFFPNGFRFSVLWSFEFLSSAVIFGMMLKMAISKRHPILIILLAAAAGVAAGFLQEYLGV